jgi:TonB family protein
MDRKDRDTAIAQFEAMLRMANDPDIRDEAHVSELKELGAGFLALTRAIPANPVPPPVVESAAAAPARPSVIVPPIVIRQQLPAWVPDPVNRANEFNGSVRVLISAQGKVTEAEMTKSVHPAYDQLVLRAARNWLYQPARRDGVPIPSEKTVQIAVTPAPARQTGAADKSLPF